MRNAGQIEFSIHEETVSLSNDETPITIVHLQGVNCPYCGMVQPIRNWAKPRMDIAIHQRCSDCGYIFEVQKGDEVHVRGLYTEERFG